MQNYYYNQQQSMIANDDLDLNLITNSGQQRNEERKRFKFFVWLNRTFSRSLNQESVYFREMYKIYPFTYACIHALLIILTQVIVVLIQIQLNTHDMPYAYLGAGYWAPLFIVYTSLLTLLFGLKVTQTSRLLTLITALNAICIFLCLLVYILLSLFALSYYDSCFYTFNWNSYDRDNKCKHPSNKFLYYILIAVGLVNMLLDGIFLVTNLGIMTGACFKLNDDDDDLDDTAREVVESVQRI